MADSFIKKLGKIQSRNAIKPQCNSHLIRSNIVDKGPGRATTQLKDDEILDHNSAHGTLRNNKTKY